MQRIAIHSVPRSGSTWLGNIFNSHPNVAFRYQPLFSYAFKGKLNQHSSKQEIIDFFNCIEQSDDEFINQAEATNNGLVPFFEKKEIEHICYKEVRYNHIVENLLLKDKEIKVIGLIRNPLAVINSWLNAPKEFRKDLGWKVKEEWQYAPRKNNNLIEEFNGYEKWKEVALMFIRFSKEFPNSFKLVNYNDLIENSQENVEELFKFCNLNYTMQTRQFLKNSNSRNDLDSYSIFKQKSKDHQWKKTLPSYICNEIFKDPTFVKINEKFNWV